MSCSLRLQRSLGRNLPINGTKIVAILDNDTIVTVNGHQTVIFHLGGHEQVFHCCKDGEILCLCVSPDSKLIAIAESVPGPEPPYHQIRLFSRDLQHIRTLSCSRAPSFIHISSTSEYIAALTQISDVQSTVFMWSTLPEAPSKTILQWNVKFAATFVYFSPGYPIWHLCVGGKSNVLVWRHADAGSLIRVGIDGLTTQLQSQILCCCWLDSERLLIGTDAGAVHVLSPTGLVHQILTDINGLQRVTAIASCSTTTTPTTFTPTPSSFVCAGEKGQFSLYEEGKAGFVVKQHFQSLEKGTVVDLCVGSKPQQHQQQQQGNNESNSLLVVVADDTSQLTCIHVHSGEEEEAKSTSTINVVGPRSRGVTTEYKTVKVAGHCCGVQAAATCVQRPLVVLLSEDNMLSLWNTETWQKELDHQFDEEVFTVGCHPTGLWIVVAKARCLCMYHVLEAGIHVCHTWDVSGCSSIQFSKAGHWFGITCVTDNRIQIISSYTFDCVTLLQADEYCGTTTTQHNKLLSVGWSNSDSTVVTATAAGIVLEWNAATWTQRNMWKTQNHTVLAVRYALSSSGCPIVIAVVWCTAEGKDQDRIGINFFTESESTSNCYTSTPLLYQQPTSYQGTEGNHPPFPCAVSSPAATIFFGTPEGDVQLYKIPKEAGSSLCNNRDVATVDSCKHITPYTTYERLHRGPVKLLLFNEETNLLFSVGEDPSFFVFSVVNEQIVRQYGLNGANVPHYTTTLHNNGHPQQEGINPQRLIPSSRSITSSKQQHHHTTHQQVGCGGGSITSSSAVFNSSTHTNFTLHSVSPSFKNEVGSPTDSENGNSGKPRDYSPAFTNKAGEVVPVDVGLVRMKEGGERGGGGGGGGMPSADKNEHTDTIVVQRNNSSSPTGTTTSSTTTTTAGGVIDSHPNFFPPFEDSEEQPSPSPLAPTPHPPHTLVPDDDRNPTPIIAISVVTQPAGGEQHNNGCVSPTRMPSPRHVTVAGEKATYHNNNGDDESNNPNNPNNPKRHTELSYIRRENNRLKVQLQQEVDERLKLDERCKLLEEKINSIYGTHSTSAKEMAGGGSSPKHTTSSTRPGIRKAVHNSSSPPLVPPLSGLHKLPRGDTTTATYNTPNSARSVDSSATVKSPTRGQSRKAINNSKGLKSATSPKKQIQMNIIGRVPARYTSGDVDGEYKECELSEPTTPTKGKAYSTPTARKSSLRGGTPTTPHLSTTSGTSSGGGGGAGGGGGGGVGIEPNNCVSPSPTFQSGGSASLPHCRWPASSTSKSESRGGALLGRSASYSSGLAGSTNRGFLLQRAPASPTATTPPTGSTTPPLLPTTARGGASARQRSVSPVHMRSRTNATKLHNNKGLKNVATTSTPSSSSSRGNSLYHHHQQQQRSSSPATGSGRNTTTPPQWERFYDTNCNVRAAVAPPTRKAVVGPSCPSSTSVSTKITKTTRFHSDRIHQQQQHFDGAQQPLDRYSPPAPAMRSSSSTISTGGSPTLRNTTKQHTVVGNGTTTTTALPTTTGTDTTATPVTPRVMQLSWRPGLWHNTAPVDAEAVFEHGSHTPGQHGTTSSGNGHHSLRVAKQPQQQQPQKAVSPYPAVLYQEQPQQFPVHSAASAVPQGAGGSSNGSSGTGFLAPAGAQYPYTVSPVPHFQQSAADYAGGHVFPPMMVCYNTPGQLL